jgi:hypothetical protein
MAVPTEIVRLIETFERNLDAYLKGRHNETQLRQEFINPFFKALGWDVDNTQGWAEAYKEVIHEDAIRIGSATKAPDYCFRIGGTRKFFVEAKAPPVNLKDDPSPAYQLRRYAWSAKLPLSILTDFEEFAVYDCRIRPSLTDKASKGRIKYLRYTDYAEHWDEIAEVFSHDAVVKGSFDKYAVTEKRKHGTAEVDAAFLAEIEDWRDALARNIALRNPALNNRQLNYAVQVTIDRIIFLRICEDRGIEPYAQLMAVLNGPEVYQRLMAIFRKADGRYNSGLFHFEQEKGRAEGPDELTPELAIDDRPLKDILRSLYYPDSPYEFSVLPAEILGQVYEQFLGKVITLTAGHHAKVEDKPEVKKAGGVFYTPAYIVDYIVRQTVGKLLEGCSVVSYKTRPPKLDRPLRVLDPACGSGSFLLGAYQLLLNWYRDYYVAHDPDKWAAAKHPTIYQGGVRGWRLTLTERKRILLDHIYGVDIDTQAVEVTKLSLLLRVLEGEKDLALFHHERALPDLAGNIKWGNSLIGPNFYKGQQGAFFDEEERYRINVFDWHAEFPEVFKDEGFNAVVGNPPYRMLQPHNTGKALLAYLRRNYVAAEFKIEMFHLFMQRGVSLLKHGGYHGHIVPTTLLNNVYAENLRRWLTDRCCIESISVARGRVFAEADVHTSVVILRRESSIDKRSEHEIRTTSDLSEAFVKTPTPFSRIRQKRLAGLPGLVWNILINETNAPLLTRLTQEFPSLKALATINRGLITGDRDKYFSKAQKSKAYISILSGSDVQRYFVSRPSEYVLFERPETAGGCWDKEVHLAPHKIVVRQIGFKPMASILREPIAVTGNIFTVRAETIEQELYLLGIINSRLTHFFWQIMFTDFKQSFPQVTIFSLSQVPVRAFDLGHAEDMRQREQMVELVEAVLRLHQDLEKAKTPREKEAIERQIAATDAQIDQLVYELYGLTDEEIKVVAEATSSVLASKNKGDNHDGEEKGR